MLHLPCPEPGPSYPGPNNMMLFNGPRVRMGLHWARRGTVVHRLHHVTRHRIFAGPGMQVCVCVHALVSVRVVVWNVLAVGAANADMWALLSD